MAENADNEYLGGCLFVGLGATFVLLPLIFFVSVEAENVLFPLGTNAGLQAVFLRSAVFSGVLGAFISRLGGLAGACGVLSGHLCGTAYWYLTIQQTFLKNLAKFGTPTEYPDSTLWLVPLAWLGLGILVSFVPMFKNPRLKSKES